MICQNLDKINAEIDRYATEWSYGPDLITYGGRDINQLMLFKTYFKEPSDSEMITFRRKFEQHYNKDPWFSSVHAYDATRMLLSALQKDEDKARLKKTLLNFDVFRGVQTELELTAHGDITRPHYITRLDQGAEALVAKLDTGF